MFHFADLLMEPFLSALTGSGRGYEFVAPLMSPGAGAVLYAVRLSGTTLTPPAIAELARQLGPGSIDQ
jgi:hypothetical protein